MTDDVIRIFPSRANYVIMKNRMVLIEKGHSLLKRKRDALEVKLRDYTQNLDALRESSIHAIRDACFCIARLNYLGVDLRHAPMRVYPNAEVYLRLAYIRLIGVTVPKFHMEIRHTTSLHYTGLSSGGLAVAETREKFLLALEELTHYASVEYTVKVLNEGIRVNNMRVNGMEFVLIPRLKRTITYILEELDEYDREDFYRLKRSRAKRIETMKANIIQMREKRDNPEEYARKQLEEQEKRFSLPNWKSIMTPKINVNFKLTYFIKIRRRMINRNIKAGSLIDTKKWEEDLEVLEEGEIEDNDESNSPSIEEGSVSITDSVGRRLSDLSHEILEDEEEIENDKIDNEKLINASDYTDLSVASEFSEISELSENQT